MEPSENKRMVDYYPDDDSHIVIDIPRMEEAMAGPYFTVPDNLTTHEEVMKWMDDCNEGKIEPSGES